MLSGYLHPLYAASFSEFGTPLELPSCGGWILKRRISDTDSYDAMNCYPLFSCLDWSKLEYDLDRLAADEIVCVHMVTDPFGSYNNGLLAHCFPDVMRPFKEHFVVDLRKHTEQSVDPRHRRKAYNALRVLSIEECKDPRQLLDDWTTLYSVLTEKHQIKGIARFSRSIFAKQLAVPGMIVFRAVYDCRTVAMLLCYVQGGVAYYHLGASGPEGYRLQASFGLFWNAIQHFASSGLRWFNLGAGPGIKNGEERGLTRFKRGWATDTRTTYFCGRIFDQSKYAQFAEKRGRSETNYFPAYREGEFE